MREDGRYSMMVSMLSTVKVRESWECGRGWTRGRAGIRSPERLLATKGVSEDHVAGTGGAGWFKWADNVVVGGASCRSMSLCLIIRSDVGNYLLRMLSRYSRREKDLCRALVGGGYGTVLSMCPPP